MALRHPERYATLLRIRQHHEDSKAEALAVANNAVYRAQENRKEILRRREALMERASLYGGHIDVQDLQRIVQFDRTLVQRIDQAEQAIDDCKQERVTCHEAFNEVHRERKIVERLIEKAHAYHNQLQRKQEQQRNDEIASMRGAHRRMKRVQDRRE